MTDEGRSLYERAAAAADAGEIAAPERRPTLRAEETYVIEENIIERANREQAEAWAELEALRAENERLRTANRNLLHTIERLGDQMLEGEARRD